MLSVIVCCAARQVVFLLLSQKDSGFKAASVLNALRSAAVMALPPKAISSDGDCEELDGDVTEAVRCIEGDLAGNGCGGVVEGMREVHSARECYRSSC